MANGALSRWSMGDGNSIDYVCAARDDLTGGGGPQARGGGVPMVLSTGDSV